MKEGRTLETIVAELIRQAESKRDFLTPAKHLHFDCNGTAPALLVDLPEGGETFPLLETGHAQLAERLEIPKAYYDRMRDEAPWLLEENVRTWLSRSEKQYLVRTLDHRARAILSDRYRVLDNDELANVALPVLIENGFEVISAEITERKSAAQERADDAQDDCGDDTHGVPAGVDQAGEEPGDEAEDDPSDH